MKLDYPINQPHIRARIIGIILILIGASFLFNPTYLNQKISFTMVLIGLFFIIIISETVIPKRISDSQIKINIDSIDKKNSTDINDVVDNLITNKKTRLLMSEKITLIIIAWILILFFITGDADLEIFFTLIFIGILAIKLLTDEFTTIHLKKRMYIFISVFLIAYIIIIAQKIINILDI